MTQKISQELLDILLCPNCKNKLLYNKKNQELICEKLCSAYKIKDGIPIMLSNKAKN